MPGVMPWYDLSFQHASPTVLRRMRRFGGTEPFLELIDRVRAREPLAGVRSNVIVGFPGETEADVDELERFLAAARLDVVGVFGYSDEDGTEAEDLDGKLPDDVIAERVERLTALVEELTAQRALERVGERVVVLVEEHDDEDPTVAVGRAEHQGPDVDGVCLAARGRRRRAAGRGVVRRGRRRRRRGGRPGRGDPMSEKPLRPVRPGPLAEGRATDPYRVGVDPASPVVPATGPSAWNIANYLTMLRLLLVPVFGWLLLVDDGLSPPTAGSPFGVFAVAMITDRIDGDLARSRGLVTNFGKVVDPIADKALVTMALVGLSIIGEVWWWVTIVVLVREWGITAVRFWVIRHGVMAAGRGGKVKTLLQTFGIGLFVIPRWTLPFPDLWEWVASICWVRRSSSRW